jgi:hypothetical protein
LSLTRQQQLPRAAAPAAQAIVAAVTQHGQALGAAGQGAERLRPLLQQRAPRAVALLRRLRHLGQPHLLPAHVCSHGRLPARRLPVQPQRRKALRPPLRAEPHQLAGAALLVGQRHKCADSACGMASAVNKKDCRQKDCSKQEVLQAKVDQKASRLIEQA